MTLSSGGIGSFFWVYATFKFAPTSGIICTANPLSTVHNLWPRCTLKCPTSLPSLSSPSEIDVVNQFDSERAM
ncbi:hypothetical protein B0H14DRAFT_2823788 [Mycena olivaceomarginata]|nr:hypothetical protein B0H14DRAFT_2823760 [Mycena olivaceomarginata]KAJ7824456.1 hypothetical protein B0H14DRAFT_2823788 [Mycena olivaceomarginata]